MAKNNITQWSTTALSNSDVGGIGILGTNIPENFDNALREIMKQIADLNTGVSFIHDTYKIADSDEETKLAKFDAGSITAGQTRTFTFPDESGIFAVSMIDSSDDGSKNSALNIPSGTTAQEPSSPDGVQIRYDTDLNVLRLYNGTSYTSIGSGFLSYDTAQTLVASEKQQALKNLGLINNRQNLHIDSNASYASATDIQLTEFDLTITTIDAGSKVHIDIIITYERNENGMFYLKRNGVEIGSHPVDGSRTVGIAPITYDADVGSTLEQTVIHFEDAHGSIGDHEYTLHVRGVSSPFFLNRTSSSSDSSTVERGTSNIRLQEVL